MALIVAASGAYALSRFADQAFADSLGLRTVRVGTDPVSWVTSHMTGLSPDIEKSKIVPIYVENMTDEYGVDFSEIFTSIDERLTQYISKLAPGLFRQIALTVQRWVLHNQIILAVHHSVKAYSPWLYSFLFKTTPLMWIFRKCTMHTFSYLNKVCATFHLIKGSEKPGNIRIAVSLSFSMIAALFTPTLKFRYCEAEAKKTFKDLLVGNVVLTTEKKLSPLNIGILGTLKNSVGFPSINKVSKVALGMTKLAIAGAVAYGTYRLCPNFVESHKTALIAGAAFALI